MKLSDREYICKECGLVIDRDINAAINICTVGLTGTGMEWICTDACGDTSSGLIFNILGETSVDESGKTLELKKSIKGILDYGVISKQTIG